MTPAATFPTAGHLNGHPAVLPTDSSVPTPTGVAGLTLRLTVGDEAAFREFHALYFDRLHHFLLAVTQGETHAAQEALQETLLRVARYVRRFDDNEIFWSWLKAVARSAARDGSRKRRRYLARLQEFALGRIVLLEAERSPEPDRMRALLAETLADLPPSDRRLIEGKYFLGETVAELAAQAGLSDKAIESRLGRLRQQLGTSVRKKLQAP